MYCRPFNFNVNPRIVHKYAKGRRITRLLNSLSLLFPEGEKFFIQSLRNYEKDCSPELRAKMAIFYKQEANHSREHRKLNAMLGVPLDEVNYEISHALEKHSQYNPSKSLMITHSLEMLTGLGGHLVNKFGGLFLKDNTACDLWRAHAIEEVEHVAVSSDVCKECLTGVGPLRRSLVFIESCYMLAKQTKRNYGRLSEAEWNLPTTLDDE